ncbi:MAG: exodeoxyribonuclease VII small subunit [Candidatus Eisenbacteria sp.]|nr:exodeoxyribonuclease VII small subunit [Candidatus Eisenbacteria bacterium]
MSGKPGSGGKRGAGDRGRQPADGRTVEEALGRLEEIVRQLEGGEIELAQALALCREGRDLHDLCVRRISAFEEQLEILSADGELTPEGNGPAGRDLVGGPGGVEGEE